MQVTTLCLGYWSRYVAAMGILLNILAFLLTGFISVANAKNTSPIQVQNLTNGNITANWTFHYTEDANEIRSYTNAAFNAPSGDKPHHVVIAHEAGTKLELSLQAPATSVIEFELPEGTAETVEDADESKTVLVVASAQTVASTFSFMYFSTGSMTASAVSSVVCGALNYYFSQDPTRWGTYLKWGEKYAGKFFDLIGLKKVKEGQRFSKISHLVTGAIGAIGMTYMYGGILACDGFMSQVNQFDFHSTLITNGLIASFYTGIWDSVFINQQKQQGNTVTDRAMKNVWRAKNLFSAFLSPAIYLDLTAAKVVAVSSGVLAATALWKPEVSSKVFNKVVEKVSSCKNLLSRKN